jgi:O-antigen/teichoic acid export membrane protein
LLIPIYVRYLTQADVGTLVFLEAIAIAFSRIFHLGLGQAVKRFYLEYEDGREADAFAASIWWVAFLIAGLGCGVLSFSASYWGLVLTKQVLPYYVVLAIVGAFLRSNFNIPLQRFIIRGEPVKHGVFTALQFLTTTGLIIYLVVGESLGIEGVLWGEVVSYALWTVVAAFIVMRPALPNFRKKEIVASIRFAVPVVPHLIFAWGITFVDRLILERFVTLEALGIYGIGYQLASAISIISLAIVNAWISPFFKLAGKKEGPEEYRRILTYFCLTVFMITLVLVVLSREIIYIVATAKYLESAIILRLVAVGLVFHGIYQALLLPLFYVQKTQWISVVTGIAFFINLGLNLTLIPKFGIYAAAVSTIGAYVVTAILTYLFVQRFYRIEIEYRRIGLACGTAVGFWWLASWFSLDSITESLLIKVSLLLLYPVFLFLFPGFFSGEEKKRITQLKYLFSTK